MCEKPKTAPHGILKNSKQEFSKPSNEIKISSIRSLNADEINEFKMLEVPMKLKVAPPPAPPSPTIKKIVEKPREIPENPNKNPTSSRSSRTNYLNISSNESIHSSQICGKKLSKRNSTERYKRNPTDESISSREKREIEKYFGSFHKPSTVSYNSRSNSQSESCSEEETKQKNIEKILELIKLKNRKHQLKKNQQEEKLSMYLPASNEMFGHKSQDYERAQNSRIKRSKNPAPSQNFIQKNIRASSTNLRKTSSHRIISSKSVAKYSPPLESLKLDQEPIQTMMEAVKSSEEKIVSFFFLLFLRD